MVMYSSCVNRSGSCSNDNIRYVGEKKMSRLIDADETLQKKWSVEIKDMFHMTETVEVVSAIDIEEAPTVEAIPIDKPFLKMRYGDYVVYNKKWLVDHLQTEWNILQGKEYPLIPVEWIKKWCNKEHNRKTFEERLLRRYGVITMLEDWEKENEIDKCR